MIELRNKQYATILEGVAGEELRIGTVITATKDASNTGLKFTKATAATAATVWGTLIAHWINPNNEAVTYSGDEDGLGYTENIGTDAVVVIPSGSRMYAVAGKGVTEIRFFKSALNDDFATTLPDVGTVLGVSSTDSMLCASDASDVITSFTAAARVVARDSISIAVILG